MEKGDVSPELLEKILTDFRNTIKNSEQIRHLEKLVAEGKATYAEALDYAEEVGNALAGAFQKNLSADLLPDGKMYWNIIQKVVRPPVQEDYEMVSELAYQLQQNLNNAAGLHIKAQKAKFDEDRFKGIAERIAHTEDFDKIKWILGAEIVNFSEHIVDQTVEDNAEFQERSGLHPKIIRKSAGKCCDWCTNLAGTYDYYDIRGGHDVFHRHENCRCLVTYDPGSGKRRINIHTKQWIRQQDDYILDARKTIGLIEEPKDFLQRLALKPKMLGAFTPSSLKKELEKQGYNVTPLTRGRLKGKEFEQGGGYKVNFKDGGLMAYHPEESSHHDGAYYKISTGKTGIKRYDLNGNEKPEKGSA